MLFRSHTVSGGGSVAVTALTAGVAASTAASVGMAAGSHGTGCAVAVALTASAVASGGMTAAASAMGTFHLRGQQPTWLALASLLGYMVSFSLGLGAIPWLLMGELFGAAVRARREVRRGGVVVPRYSTVVRMSPMMKSSFSAITRFLRASSRALSPHSSFRACTFFMHQQTRARAENFESLD